VTQGRKGMEPVNVLLAGDLAQRLRHSRHRVSQGDAGDVMTLICVFLCNARAHIEEGTACVTHVSHVTQGPKGGRGLRKSIVCTGSPCGPRVPRVRDARGAHPGLSPSRRGLPPRQPLAGRGERGREDGWLGTTENVGANQRDAARVRARHAASHRAGLCPPRAGRPNRDAS
jgi:hypothetical protein